MAKAQNFPFDTSAFADFWNPANYTKMFGDTAMPEFDPAALMDTQKKNMDALVAANKAAAEAYKDLFKKQLAVFEETMAEAKKQAEGFDMSKLTPENAAKQGEVVKAAFEKALANMTDLAEEARKANADAYATVSARIQASAKELGDLAKGLTQ